MIFYEILLVFKSVFFILMEIHLLIDYIFCRAPRQWLNTTRQVYQHSHTNFKQLARNALKPFQRFDFNYILWDSQLSLYILINETSNWNPALLCLHTLKNKSNTIWKGWKGKRKITQMRLKIITKQNQTSEKSRAGGQAYAFSFAKDYFLMHSFPQKWFWKTRIPRAVIQFIK